MATEHTDRRRLALPVLHRVYDPVAPYAYALMRLCVGAFIIPHGYTKLFKGALGPTIGMLSKAGLESPTAWAYLVTVTEFFGGIMLAIGLLTRLAAAALVIEFAVIVFVIKFASGFFGYKGGFEYELLLGLLCLAIFFKGGGRYSVDSLLGKEL